MIEYKVLNETTKKQNEHLLYIGSKKQRKQT